MTATNRYQNEIELCMNAIIVNLEGRYSPQDLDIDKEAQTAAQKLARLGRNRAAYAELGRQVVELLAKENL